MLRNEILEEVRKHRDEFIKENENSIEKIFEAL